MFHSRYDSCHFFSPNTQRATFQYLKNNPWCLTVNSGCVWFRWSLIKIYRLSPRRISTLYLNPVLSMCCLMSLFWVRHLDCFGRYDCTLDTDCVGASCESKLNSFLCLGNWNPHLPSAFSEELDARSLHLCYMAVQRCKKNWEFMEKKIKSSLS